MLFLSHPYFSITKIKQQRQVGVAIFGSGNLVPVTIHDCQIGIQVSWSRQIYTLELNEASGIHMLIRNKPVWIVGHIR